MKTSFHIAWKVVLLLFTINTLSFAQHSLQIDDGSGNVSIIAAPASSGTYTLPTGGGMLITSGTTGSSPWLLGGNALSAAGSSPTQWFGTSTNDDVILKANSVVKLRLVSGGGVVIPGSALSINGVGYTFPAAAPNGVLTNSGGTLTWAASGGGMAFADFYALMPGDNAATVAVGAAVDFPQDGPNSGSITRTGNSTFELPNIGTYEVFFQVSVTEAGQLAISIDGIELAYTVVGRATGTSQLTGMCLVTTTGINSILEVVNPTGNSTALTITPLAGGANSVSAHLVIKQLQ